MTAMSYVPLDQLRANPENLRADLDLDSPDESGLRDTIATLGLIQPLNVRANGEGYVVTAGHRRLANIVRLVEEGRPTMDDFAGAGVACLVDDRDVSTDDAPTDTVTLQMLVENLQRKDISPLDEARGFKRLTTMKVSQKTIADSTGVSTSHVSRRLMLLELPPQAQADLEEGKVEVDYCLELLKLRRWPDVMAIAYEQRWQSWKIKESADAAVRDEALQKANALLAEWGVDENGVELFLMTSHLLRGRVDFPPFGGWGHFHPVESGEFYKEVERADGEGTDEVAIDQAEFDQLCAVEDEAGYPDGVIDVWEDPSPKVWPLEQLVIEELRNDVVVKAVAPRFHTKDGKATVELLGYRFEPLPEQPAEGATPATPANDRAEREAAEKEKAKKLRAATKHRREFMVETLGGPAPAKALVDEFVVRMLLHELSANGVKEAVKLLTLEPIGTGYDKTTKAWQAEVDAALAVGGARLRTVLIAGCLGELEASIGNYTVDSAPQVQLQRELLVRLGYSPPSGSGWTAKKYQPKDKD